jgi:hypothetical protein
LAKLILRLICPFAIASRSVEGRRQFLKKRTFITDLYYPVPLLTKSLTIDHANVIERVMTIGPLFCLRSAQIKFKLKLILRKST